MAWRHPGRGRPRSRGRDPRRCPRRSPPTGRRSRRSEGLRRGRWSSPPTLRCRSGRCWAVLRNRCSRLRARAAAARMPRPTSLFFIEDASHYGFGQEPRRMPSAAGGGPARRRGDALMVECGGYECQHFLDDRHGRVEYERHPLNGTRPPSARSRAHDGHRRIIVGYLLPIPMSIGILNPPAAQRRPHEERTSISGTHDSRPQPAGRTRTRQRLLAGDDGQGRPGLEEAQHAIPAGTKINVTFLGNEDLDMRVAAAKAVRDMGFVPVPHISARRLKSQDQLEEFLGRLQEVGATEHVFSVGGDPADARGSLSRTRSR